MAGIIQGFEECPTAIDAQGVERPTRKPVALIDIPTPIKSIRLEAPTNNERTVYYGDSLLASGYGLSLSPGESREFIFRHDSKESPGDLKDFRVVFGHEYDMIKYLAITV
tara:strand:- start:619 stop:948 length:330 start_codon:yes stop_codon:yes gene_type:complete